MIKLKTTWMVEGPYEDQFRKTTGEKSSRKAALKAGEEFLKDIDKTKLRLVKITRTEQFEFMPYDDAMASDH